MGNTTSQEKDYKKQKNHLNRGSTFFRKSPKIPQLSNDRLPSPNKSIFTSASKSNSQTNSVIEDIRINMQKNLSRNSTSEISIQHRKSNMSNKNSSTSLETDRSMCPKTNYKCCLPAEETMEDYLMNAHFVIKHLFDGNFSAPVHEILSNSVSVAKDIVPLSPEPDTPPLDASCTPTTMFIQDTVARGLDIICGTGTWTMEMACIYPNSEFYGIGYDAIYPTSIKPPNAHFSTSNILGPTGFPFPDKHFDYIHMRFVWGYFSVEDVQFVMTEVNRVLKPGGYFEMRDCDPVMKNTGSIGTQLYEDLNGYIQKHHNIDSMWIQHLPMIFSHRAGLTDIHHQVIPIVFEKSGPMSACVNNFLSDGIKSYKPLFVESCCVSPEECDMMIQKTIEEALEKRSFFNFYICWGRKPLIVEKLVTTPPIRLNSQPFSFLAKNYMASDVFPVSPCQSPSVLLESADLSASMDDICQFAKGFIE